MKYIFPFLLVLFYVFLIPFFQGSSAPIPLVPASVAGFSVAGMPFCFSFPFLALLDVLFGLRFSLTMSFLVYVLVIGVIENRFDLGKGLFSNTLFGFIFLFVFLLVSKTSGFYLGFSRFLTTFLFMEAMIFMEVDHEM